MKKSRVFALTFQLRLELKRSRNVSEATALRMLALDWLGISFYFLNFNFCWLEFFLWKSKEQYSMQWFIKQANFHYLQHAWIFITLVKYEYRMDSSGELPFYCFYLIPLIKFHSDQSLGECLLMGTCPPSRKFTCSEGQMLFTNAKE